MTTQLPTSATDLEALEVAIHAVGQASTRKGTATPALAAPFELLLANDRENPVYLAWAGVCWALVARDTQGEALQAELVGKAVALAQRALAALTPGHDERSLLGVPMGVAARLVALELLLGLPPEAGCRPLGLQVLEAALASPALERTPEHLRARLERHASLVAAGGPGPARPIAEAAWLVGARARQSVAPGCGPALWVSSEAGALARGAVQEDGAGGADHTVALDRPLQRLAGFGGAVNERGWEALGALPEPDRDRVLDRLFAPGEGLSLAFCRIPVGASDFARVRYSLDDGPEDLELRRFSIARDREALLPFVRAARLRNPALRCWASAWSPPPWMKTNGAFDGGAMRDEPAVYAAYARYLARFVEAYAAEGIPVEAVAVQNEPTTLTDYPSCRWAPDQFRIFVRDHLGPALAAGGGKARVLLGTLNGPDNLAHALAVLRDPAARTHVSALGLQWDGLPIAPAAREVAPGLPIWHTETDCGNHPWEAGFDGRRPHNDWRYALDTWRSVRRYLLAGAETYSLWNLVLDETGLSLDERRPWPQNAPVVVDREAQRACFTPAYFAVAHVSRWAVPGSTLLAGEGSREAVAFRRPDGAVAVALANPTAAPRTMRVRVGGTTWAASLPARGFGTLLVASP